MKKLIYAKMKFFDLTTSGSIINRLCDDIFKIDDDIPWLCAVLLGNI